MKRNDYVICQKKITSRDNALFFRRENVVYKPKIINNNSYNSYNNLAIINQ